MEAKVFNGRKLAWQKEKNLQKKVRQTMEKIGYQPKLVAILIGQNSASQIYLNLKEKVAERVGVDFERKDFPEDVSPGLIIEEIKKANQDEKVAGIMVQLPLPKQSAISNQQLAIIDAIAPEKDVDCLTTANLELLKKGKPRFLPATTKAILSIFKEEKINLAGKKIVVVGVKGFVGEPLFHYLKVLGCNVTGIDKETKDLGKVTKEADILISSTGVPNLIKTDMVKEGAVVIDVGSPKGDVDPSTALRASFVTPVPGGVGPLTVICLLENLCYNL